MTNRIIERVQGWTIVETYDGRGNSWFDIFNPSDIAIVMDLPSAQAARKALKTLLQNSDIFSRNY